MKYAIFNPSEGKHIIVENKEKAICQRLDLIAKYARPVEEYTVCEIIEHENNETWVLVSFDSDTIVENQG